MEQIRKLLHQIKKRGLYPDVKVLESAPYPEVVIGGRKILMFGSYNYLGLSVREEVKNAAIEAVKKYGIGSGGSRLISGTYDIHVELEKKLADFKREEDCMTFSSGYGTNVGVIAGAMDLLGLVKKNPLMRKNIVLSDELNHASIIDGCKLARVKVCVYKHKDMNDLERLLRKFKKNRKIIITDGVFSMDGDIAPLDKIVELAKHYKAMTMVDDAHATGILGDLGGGTSELFGVEGQIDINMSTCKAFGSVGGFVTGKKELIDFLRISTRSYVFAQSLPPLICAAIMKSVDIINEEPELRYRLLENAKYLKESLNELGLNTLQTETPIVPVLLGTDQNAIKAQRIFFENGIFAPTVRWPAVEKGKSRVRFVLMATHKREQVDKLLYVTKKVKESLKISN